MTSRPALIERRSGISLGTSTPDPRIRIADRRAADLRNALIAAHVKAIRFYRRGVSPARAFDQFLPMMRDHIQEAMLTAFARGWSQSATNSKARSIAMSLSDDAITFALRKAELTPSAVQSVAESFGTAASNVTAAYAQRINTATADVLAEITKQGLHVRDAIRFLQQSLEETSAFITPAIAETEVRTHTMMAYSAGRVKANEDPAIQDILWGYEYVTVGDDRVRPTHAKMEGMRRPKDDPVWKTCMTPNGYNCRCTVIEVFNGEQLARATRLPTGEWGPDKGFNFNPADLVPGLLRAA